MSPQNKAVLLARVESALDDIRPHLAVDGGDIELVDITDDYMLEVRWLGACSTCQMTAMTMQAGIEETIRSKVSQIQGIKAINSTSLNDFKQ